MSSEETGARRRASVADAVTWLFVPGTASHRFAKAAATGTDMVIVDLEDSVGPADKDRARDAARDWLAGGQRAAVRINGAGTPWYDADLAMVRHIAPAAVVLPKADRESVERLGPALSEVGVPLLALIETARAVRALDQICRLPGVSRLAVGTLDLAAGLDCDVDASPVQHACDEAILASAASGLPGPIDSVFPQLDDERGLAAAADLARRRGFAGKLAVHPRQVPVIQEAFAPTAAEIEWARRVLEEPTDGVRVVDGAMVDAPVVERARRLLRRAGGG